MKKSFTKITVFILAVVFMLSITACSDKRNQPVEPDIPDDPKVTEPLIYSHVVILGVDGAGAFFNQTDTPNIDRIFADGATTYSASAEIPTISAQNWGSMIHGVACDVHGFTNDIISASTIDSSYEYPSIFKVIKGCKPEANLCSVVKWGPINYGLVEWDIGVHMYDCENDLEVTEMTERMIKDFYPEFLFVQFDEVDETGHSYGYGSQEYLDRITTIDGYIGRIFDTYDELGILADTLFIVVADHGGTNFRADGVDYHDHGGTTPEETNVFLGIAGPSVANTELKDVRNRDVAAITAAALGIEIPEIWTSKVPEGLFTDR